MRKQVINPHDEITIDCTNEAAAALAIILIGNGWYGIDGLVPVLAFGGIDKWLAETFGASDLNEWVDSVESGDLAAALESMQHEGERSSISNPVAAAHDLAAKVRQRVTTESARGGSDEQTFTGTVESDRNEVAP